MSPTIIGSDERFPEERKTAMRLQPSFEKPFRDHHAAGSSVSEATRVPCTF